MQVTRRFRTVAGVALVLAASGALFERPLLLYGAAGVGAWLLAAQYGFVRALARTDDALAIDLNSASARAATDTPVAVRLTATLDRPSPLHLTVTAEPPVGMDAPTPAARSAELVAGGRTATASFPVESPVAGEYAFGRSSVAAEDARGLFRETLAREPSLTVSVTPRTPRNVHVGRSGERAATAYGEHDTDRFGSGLEPTEIRRYVAGDSVSRIDWKATARLSAPHVRKFEMEADRTVALLVDHRATMGDGRPGETKLDYAREVALSFVESARDLDDRIGLYAVGDGGVTETAPPQLGTTHYDRIAAAVSRLSPTARPGGGAAGSRRSPGAARLAAARLSGDGSAFGRRLEPFFAAGDPYIESIETDPLFATARAYLSRIRDTKWTVLVTDDAARAEVHETVKLLRRHDNHVLAFLAPTGLFEPGGLADLEAAYDRYRSFDRFRRRLARLDRVRAYEVAPGDRLEAVLGSQRRSRRPEVSGR